jgi:hypothetical protein
MDLAVAARVASVVPVKRMGDTADMAGPCLFLRLRKDHNP